MQKKVLGRTAAALASRAWLASLASLMGRSIGAAFAFGNAPAAGRRSGDRRWTAVVRAPACAKPKRLRFGEGRSEEHTSELQSLMRISYAVFCLKKKTKQQ